MEKSDTPSLNRRPKAREKELSQALRENLRRRKRQPQPQKKQ